MFGTLLRYCWTSSVCLNQKCFWSMLRISDHMSLFHMQWLSFTVWWKLLNTMHPMCIFVRWVPSSFSLEHLRLFAGSYLISVQHILYNLPFCAGAPTSRDGWFVERVCAPQLGRWIGWALAPCCLVPTGFHLDGRWVVHLCHYCCKLHIKYSRTVDWITLLEQTQLQCAACCLNFHATSLTHELPSRLVVVCMVGVFGT